jgi:hypothetical protein
MKKFVASLFVGAMLAAGLVSAGTGTATAASGCSPYAGQIATHTGIKGHKRAHTGQRAKLKFHVSGHGTVKPMGVLKLKIRGKGVRYKHNFNYTGGLVKFKTPVLRKVGKYKVKVKFAPVSCSVYKHSKAKRIVTVRKFHTP